MSEVELDASTADATQARLIEVGTDLMQRLWPDRSLRAFALPQDDAVLLVQPFRGGGSLYVAADESVMFAASSLSNPDALELFRSGRRTPLEDFTPAPAPGSSR